MGRNGIGKRYAVTTIIMCFGAAPVKPSQRFGDLPTNCLQTQPADALSGCGYIVFRDATRRKFSSWLA
jgi:hypothetical protein